MIQDSTITAAGSGLSREEFEKAQSYLRQTRDIFVDQISGLTPAQWSFKPDGDCWSIGEIAEHHILTERAIQSKVQTIGDAPPPPQDWNPAAIDEMIPSRIPDRSTKVKAPDALLPSGRYGAEQSVQEFLQGREHTETLLNVRELRAHVWPHPIRGFWDGYHWILAIGAHGARHAGQIAEWKNDPNFPRRE